MRFSLGPLARRSRVRAAAATGTPMCAISSSSSSGSDGGTGGTRLVSLLRQYQTAPLLSNGVSPAPLFRSLPHTTGAAALTAARRWQSRGPGDGFHSSEDDFMNSSGEHGYVAEDTSGLQSELVHELEGEGNLSLDAAMSQPLTKADLHTPSARIRLEKIERPPGRFDMLTNSLVYRWQTTAALARKVSGPMREWASELKYRTGVHLEVEPTYPERLTLPEADGGYATADEVELTVYLFGSERGIFNCRQLMESALDQDPAYVRLGVFRRVRGGKSSSMGGSSSGAAAVAEHPPKPEEEIEWLLLRRINRDLRPPDIPPISLKLPGKWTMLYEQYKEAAIRSLWEETGITVDPANVFPTGCLTTTNPTYYWRVPVHYFIAEVPYDVEVLGPQVGLNIYMHHWDAQLLRQSPDPIDRAWAQLANPETGCAWMKVPMIDELQRPLRGADYMATRYTPPPYSGLNDVLGFVAPPSEKAAATAEGEKEAGAAVATAATAAVSKGEAASTEAAPDSAEDAIDPKPRS